MQIRTDILNKLLWFVLIASAMLITYGASAAELEVHRGAHWAHAAARAAAADQCQLYGFARGTRDYAECRLDVRRYWTTGPCGSESFAAVHRGYCHLKLPPFI